MTKLRGESGGDAHERRAEATRLLKVIEASKSDECSFNKLDTDVIEKLGDPSEPVSTSQLFWLRDIRDRCLGL